jgi:hypothetical protein
MIYKLSIIFSLIFFGSLIGYQTTLTQPGTMRHSDSIHISTLNQSKVIGLLGYALGEVVIVEGVVANETYTKKKDDAGKLLLRVQIVNGKPLKEEVIFHFSLLLSIDIKKPIVGAKFKYIGYETGGFVGIPEKAFNYVPPMTTTGHHFSTSFVILRDENGLKSRV